MYGVCFRYVCHREIAQDLLHDGFITVFSKIGDFRGEGSLEGWIRRIFVNTALGYLRKKNVLQGSEQIDALRQVEGTEASAVERMETAELLRCIGKLPDGYRAVLNLFAVERVLSPRDCRDARRERRHFALAISEGQGMSAQNTERRGGDLR